LEAIPLSHPDERFNTFKQQMRRFQPHKRAGSESNEFFQAEPLVLEAERFDPLNPTQNV
jgi:hypothetical protein